MLYFVVSVILLNTLCGWKLKQARYKGNGNEKRDTIKSIKYYREDNSLFLQ